VCRAVYENPETSCTHPMPNSEEMSQIDPGLATLDWPEEVLKRKDGIVRTDVSLIFADFEASGQGDPEALPNFLGPTARRTLTIKDRTLLHVSISLCMCLAVQFTYRCAVHMPGLPGIFELRRCAADSARLCRVRIRR